MVNRNLTIKALLLAFALILVVNVGIARAVEVTQIPWDHSGAENLPCASDVHWVLSPGHGIDNATVGIGTHDWGMLKNWDDESWYIDTPDPVSMTDDVAVAYTGTAETPTLTLVGCTPAEVVVTPPPPDQPPAPAPVPATTSWDIGFQVRTFYPTNVVARYKLTCSNATQTVAIRHRVQAKTPLVRHLTQTLADATSCHIHVVASDIKPFANPNHPRPPKVSTWVTQL